MAAALSEPIEAKAGVKEEGLSAEPEALSFVPLAKKSEECLKFDQTSRSVWAGVIRWSYPCFDFHSDSAWALAMGLLCQGFHFCLDPEPGFRCHCFPGFDLSSDRHHSDLALGLQIDQDRLLDFHSGLDPDYPPSLKVLVAQPD